MTISFLKALLLALRTTPFIAVRVVAYAGVAAGLALLVVAGAWAGLGTAPGLGNGLVPDTVLGGMFGAVVGILWLTVLRDWLFHRVEAGMLALSVDWLDGKRLPLALDQVAAAHASVTRRFGSSDDLAALGRLVRGVASRVPEVSDGPMPLVSLPRLTRLATGGLVDRCILAHAYAARPENAWEAAHDGIVLVAQNARALLVAAGWINLVGWLATAGVFFAVLGPVSGLSALWPGQGPQIGVYVLAGLAAWAVRAAVVHPVMVATFVQAFRRIAADQDPSPEWRGRLTQLCDRFRQLGERAITWGPKAGTEA